MLNGEFDKAEDILRKYVKDFNYKLINATFELLQKEKKSNSKIDYSRYKIHLMDNYSRMNDKSMLNEVLDEVKVEDSIEIKKTTNENSKDSDTSKKDIK